MFKLRIVNKNNFDAEVCGWPASGSTLTYQICKYLNLSVSKTHGINENKNVFKYLFTIRDPRDIILSNAKRASKDIYESDPSEAVSFEINRFIKSKYEASFYKAQKIKNCIILRYEDIIMSNEKNLIRLIALNFQRDIDQSSLENIYNEVSIGKNLERSSKNKKFGEYEKDSLIHGNHISNQGKIGGWQDELNVSQINEIHEKLGVLLKKTAYLK